MEDLSLFGIGIEEKEQEDKKTQESIQENKTEINYKDYWGNSEKANEFRTKMSELQNKLIKKYGFPEENTGLSVYKLAEVKRASKDKSNEFYFWLVKLIKLNLEFAVRLNQNGEFELERYEPSKNNACDMNIWRMYKWIEKDALVHGAVHNYLLEEEKKIKKDKKVLKK